MILALDPSYTGFGIAILDDDLRILHTERFKCSNKVYGSITEVHQNCQEAVSRINQLIDEEFDSLDYKVIVEYPVLASRPGAYLAILNGYLASTLQENGRVSSIVWVPPMAVNSFSKNKEDSKTYLVNYAMDEFCLSKRISHDEATALILAKMLIAIRTNKYKNSYFVYNR